jgi:excisionase family DNA binding protein
MTEQQIDNDRQPLTVQEAAAWLKVSASTIYAMCSSGQLDCFRVGVGRGSIRINKNALVTLEREGGKKQSQHVVTLKQLRSL